MRFSVVLHTTCVTVILVKMLSARRHGGSRAPGCKDCVQPKRGAAHVQRSVNLYDTINTRQNVSAYLIGVYDKRLTEVGAVTAVTLITHPKGDQENTVMRHVFAG